MQRIAVTGANGYVGSNIVKYLVVNNYKCVRLVRNPISAEDKKFILGSPISNNALSDIDVLIHVAHDFTSSDWKSCYDINVKGADLLFAAAKTNGVKKIIFVSSMSSFENCKSRYGKSKLLIEQLLKDKYSGYILRPGLIYGGTNGGVIATLHKITNMKIIPLVAGDINQYFCNITDLCNLIKVINEDQLEKFINSPVIAANSTPYKFITILKILGAKYFIKIPWKLVFYIIKIAELCGVRPRTGSDSLKSLINQNPFPDFKLTQLLPVTFRKLDINEIQKKN